MGPGTHGAGQTPAKAQPETGLQRLGDGRAMPLAGSDNQGVPVASGEQDAPRDVGGGRGRSVLGCCSCWEQLLTCMSFLLGSPWLGVLLDGTFPALWLGFFLLLTMCLSMSVWEGSSVCAWRGAGAGSTQGERPWGGGQAAHCACP